MKYEKQLLLPEKQKWVDLGVTIGSDEALIEFHLSRFKSFLNNFKEVQIIRFNELVGITYNKDNPLILDNNPPLLRSFLLKRFMDQHGLEVIQESRQNLLQFSESQIYINLLDELLAKGMYPEDIYVYTVFRQRGTPNTWLNIIGEYTPDQVQQLLDSKLRSLVLFLNKKLGFPRKRRFIASVGNLRIYMFTKHLDPKVFIGYSKNIEAQRGSFTIIVFDREKKRIGVVTGSKKEVLMLQIYIRKYLLPDSIGIPRSDIQANGRELFEKLLRSYPDKGLSLQSVSFKDFPLPGNPKLRLRVEGDESLDAALEILLPDSEDMSLDNLDSIDFLLENKNITVYLYGEDEWGRKYINVSAKRKSVELESKILDILEEILGANVKTSKFLTKILSQEFIIDKIIKNKKISSFPLPEEVEKIIVDLISKKIITKRTLAKRRCQNCYSFSWEKWNCPNCDRDTMLVVGEVVKITPNEKDILKILSKKCIKDMPLLQIAYIPTKQRAGYQKGIIRVYDPIKNVSVFVLLISNKKDIKFGQNLLEEGFGIVAIIDPDMIGKEDAISTLGCSIISLPDIICYLLEVKNPDLLSNIINDQFQEQLERVFVNLKISIDRLKNKTTGYNESIFEIDIKNILQAIVPDVIRLGTEYKGISVPDGYCYYGYKRLKRRRKIFGWDAKYSANLNYTLDIKDFEIQKKYIKWLLDPKEEPYTFGDLGIYAFITNSSTISGFTTVLEKISSWQSFPNNARLILVEDMLLVNIAEWILSHWQQVLENNSVIANTLFKWFRRKLSLNYNLLLSKQWEKLRLKLELVVSQS